jgi:hypothetical protein
VSFEPSRSVNDLDYCYWLPHRRTRSILSITELARCKTTESKTLSSGKPRICRDDRLGLRAVSHARLSTVPKWQFSEPLCGSGEKKIADFFFEKKLPKINFNLEVFLGRIFLAFLFVRCMWK